MVALGYLACSSEDEEGKQPARDAAVDVDSSSAEDASEASRADTSRPPFSCTSIDAAAVVFCDDFEGTGSAPFGFDSVALSGDGGGTAVLAEGGLAPSTKVLDFALVQNGSDAGDAGVSAFVTKSLPAGKAPNSYIHYEVVNLRFRLP